MSNAVMASDAIALNEADREAGGDAALQQNLWRRLCGLSSGVTALPAKLEHFLGAAGFDRGPWLAVAFAAGIGLWFTLVNAWQWLALLSACLAAVVAALGLLRGHGAFPFLRQSILLTALAIAAGCLTVWAKSFLVGVPGIARPIIGTFTGGVIEREEQPANARVRLLLASRHPESGQAMRIRINVPLEDDRAEASEGSVVRIKARLMPPAPPMLPGGYNFARTAWFQGIAATGGGLAPVEIVSTGRQTGWLGRLQRKLSAHVQASIGGSAGGIAAAFASGDRGNITAQDEDAMRDAGLTHLLSVSGLHVSAVIAGVYFIAIRALALWSWLALRVRLPIFAAGAGAFAGIGYTLLTGAQVPTVRSCAGALLVLLAMALGREPLSLRLLAVAALFVMLLWPEAVVGPSFQMSFASVLAIVSLHSSVFARQFMAHRDERWLARICRNMAILLITGIVIELALMPLAFYHFHRAGVFGALSNVIAIPLTTFVSMPLIALALFLDSVGAGAPVWWLAGKSLDFLLWIAHWTAARPGAVNHLPAMGAGSFVLFLGGALWLALWRGPVRLFGLVPAALATVSLLVLRPPDLLISGDGHHVGIAGERDEKLLILRDSKSGYARDNLTEIAGMSGEVALLADWPSAQCSADFCFVDLRRGGRNWKLLIARGSVASPERELVAACDLSDIVIADRWLPRSCKPKWLKADRNLLDRTGGLTISLDDGRIKSVAEGEGQHGWWQPRITRSRFKPAAARGSESALPNQ
jgi:competence protein ComEC